MTQPLPTHELIERLRAGLSSDGRKVQNGLDVSTSLRVPGALSGPLAGVSFIAGVAGALALSESPYPRQSTSKGRDPSPGPRPSSRRAMLVPLGGGAAIPLPSKNAYEVPRRRSRASATTPVTTSARVAATVIDSGVIGDRRSRPARWPWGSPRRWPSRLPWLWSR